LFDYSAVLGYVLDDWGFQSQYGLGTFPLTTAFRLVLKPMQRPIQWIPRTLSLGVNQMSHEADHSPPSSAKVKNVCSYTSLPTCLHGVVLS